MKNYDRLATLIDRFQLGFIQTSPKDANLVVLSCDDQATLDRAIFAPVRTAFNFDPERIVLCAMVDWQGSENPLMKALPAVVELELTEDSETTNLITMMMDEVENQRCGMSSVLNRLGEILIIRMMRVQIAVGSTLPGLLAGLSDQKLSKAIVAMHDNPGRDWRNDHLAQIAGMSLSRFAEVFLSKVGEPPASYLRKWRLTLARQDLEKGLRVETVARKYGFNSTAGFTRAFKKRHFLTPIEMRNRGAIKVDKTE